MKYSIIIPAYKETKKDFKRCLDSIVAQTLQPYEVIVVDDCSPSDTPKMALDYGFTYIRHEKNKQNGGARNTGVKKAKGDYLVFINADDYILPNELEEIDKVNKGEDVIFIGLQAFGSMNFRFIPDKENTPLLSKLDMNGEPMHVVNRKFWIKNDLWELENKILVDVEWVRRLEKAIKTFTYVPKALYMYQTGHSGSQLTQIGKGTLKSDREEMLNANKKDKYLIYSYHINKIGGVETYIKNKIKGLYLDKDITFLYRADNSDREQLAEIGKYAKVEQDDGRVWETDICEYASCWGTYPRVKATKKIQTLHASFQFLKDHNLFIPKFPSDIDLFVSVSKNTQKESKEALGVDSIVIYNPLDTDVKAKPLIKMMVLSRITPQKGFERLLKLCEEARKQTDYDFLYYIYSDMDPNAYTREILDKFRRYPEVIWLPPKRNLTNHMADMTYGVLFSDAEGLPYGIYEFLQLGVPCLVTDFGSARELIQDGINGYVFKMDMSDLDVEKICKKIPKFKFKPLNTKKEWLKVLVKGKKVKELPEGEYVQLRVLKKYYDNDLRKIVPIGDILEVDKERALELLAHPLELVEILFTDGSRSEDNETEEKKAKQGIQGIRSLLSQEQVVDKSES